MPKFEMARYKNSTVFVLNGWHCWRYNYRSLLQQYEYVMIAKYGGESASDDVVTCKVSSVILEPHFSVAPVRSL